MNERAEKLKEIFEDKELAKELLSIEEAEDAQKWFSDHGAELTMDEVKSLGNLFAKIADGEITEEQLRAAAGSDGELSEEELENVAGGIIFIDDFIIMGGIILGMGGLVTLGASAYFHKW